MNNLRVFIFLQKKNRKCGSKEVADHIGVTLRHAQHILSQLHKQGFIDRDNSHPAGFKVKGN